MRLTTDAHPPLFELIDVFGNQINLRDYESKRILIAFFRHAGCPFCNLRVHSLMKLHEELKASGFEMIFFFESPKEVILRSTFHKGVSPVPIISDPRKVWYAKYGLELKPDAVKELKESDLKNIMGKAATIGVPAHGPIAGESSNTVPAEFLIERGLLIKKAYYSQKINDRMLTQQVKDFALNGTV